ncbi:MAG: hypothetical protein VZR33_02430 [Methanosphaera sp.]|nr:hypothetical protein [Methanosphaera sp.]
MSKDIKRILEELKEDVEENILVEVRGIYFKPLLDYITNLQEENKKLKMDLIDQGFTLLNSRIELSCWQNKINKAIEYMKGYIEFEDSPLNENVRIEFKEVMNILNESEVN